MAASFRQERNEREKEAAKKNIKEVKNEGKSAKRRKGEREGNPRCVCVCRPVKASSAAQAVAHSLTQSLAHSCSFSASRVFSGERERKGNPSPSTAEREGREWIQDRHLSLSLSGLYSWSSPFSLGRSLAHSIALFSLSLVPTFQKTSLPLSLSIDPQRRTCEREREKAREKSVREERDACQGSARGSYRIFLSLSL